MDLIEIYVDEEDDERLDSYLAQELNQVSRTYIQKLIKEGLVLVNDLVRKPRYQVSEGDHIKVQIPKPKELEILAENILIDIVYEDEDIAIINKAKGMVVHPAPGNYSGTLVNALVYHMENLSTINGIIRPGIVHRLDKDTSGLLIIAKNDISHKFLSDKLKDRDIKREYIAICHGEFKVEKGTVNQPIARDPRDRKRMAINIKNGKEAITNYKVLDLYSGYSLVEASLETGRTHQIRVHLSYLNHPIVGDHVYSNRKEDTKFNGQLLHARKLGFIHPRTREYMEFETEIPDIFKSFIEKITK